MEKINEIKELYLNTIKKLSIDDQITAINEIREFIHQNSPFKNEPVDYVKWVRNENVVANDYNPNKVAPPEMQLLEVSIDNDGYTQPIVTFPNKDSNEVVDGFHRSRVGKESQVIKNRVLGYLPVVSIRKEKQSKQERIASTIRHNRARGKHQVSAMSEIVIELKNRNWSNDRIARELGMDKDEILRLCQISGIENLFKDKDFSKAWVSNDTDEFNEHLTDELSDDELDSVKIPNENDSERIFHTFDKWEAIEYDFYETKHKKLTPLQCEHKYKQVLSNLETFEKAIKDVFKYWQYSCEHNLTNKSINRIAWIGQACVSYLHKVPQIYSSGFYLLTDQQQEEANQLAYKYLVEWLKEKNLTIPTIDEAMQKNRQVELY